MRYLMIVLALLVLPGTLFLNDANAQGTLWGERGHVNQTTNISLGQYLTFDLNLTTIPCIYNIFYDEETSDPSHIRHACDDPLDYFKYVYPKDGYKFILCYIKITNHGYNETPARLDGISGSGSIDYMGYEGLRLVPDEMFDLLVDGHIYHQQDPYPNGSKSINRTYQRSVSYGSISKFNLIKLEGGRGTGYIFLKNGESVSGFIVFCIPDDAKEIGLQIKGMKVYGINVMKPFGNAIIPADDAKTILKLNQNMPR